MREGESGKTGEREGQRVIGALSGGDPGSLRVSPLSGASGW